MAAKVLPHLQLYHCSLVQLYFSGWKYLPELNPDIAYRNYLEKVLVTDDRRAFDLATMEFLALLRNGHTVLWDSWLTKHYGQPMGFYARPLDGKWVVQSSVIPGIKAGDVLTKIDDTEVESFFQRQKKYIAGSNETALRHNLFFLTYLFPAQWTATLEDGRKVRVDRMAARLPESERVPEGRWLAENAIAYPHFLIRRTFVRKEGRGLRSPVPESKDARYRCKEQCWRRYTAPTNEVLDGPNLPRVERIYANPYKLA
jgi:hypothetical protein